MLSMGASFPWPKAMKVMTGQEKMSADSIMRYFAPLYEWLKEQNKGYDVTWKEECPAGSFSDASDSAATSLTSMSLLAVVVVSISSFFAH